MATKIVTVSRPTDSDFGVQMVNSKISKIAERNYRAETVINGKRIEAFGHSEGLAAERLTQLVDEMTIRGELAGAIN